MVEEGSEQEEADVVRRGEEVVHPAEEDSVGEDSVGEDSVEVEASVAEEEAIEAVVRREEEEASGAEVEKVVSCLRGKCWRLWGTQLFDGLQDFRRLGRSDFIADCRDVPVPMDHRDVWHPIITQSTSLRYLHFSSVAKLIPTDPPLLTPPIRPIPGAPIRRQTRR